MSELLDSNGEVIYHAVQQRIAELERENALHTEMALKSKDALFGYETRIQALERDNGRLRDGLVKQSSIFSRIDYVCGEPNEMEVSGYDVHCNEDAVLVAVKNLRANLETAEALLISEEKRLRQQGNMPMALLVASIREEVFRNKEAK